MELWLRRLHGVHGWWLHGVHGWWLHGVMVEEAAWSYGWGGCMEFTVGGCMEFMVGGDMEL